MNTPVPSPRPYNQAQEYYYSAVLYEVMQIFTQVEVQLLYYRMTQVKVESLPFTFYSSESIKVHKMVYTLISKVQSIFCSIFWAEIHLIIQSTEI